MELKTVEKLIDVVTRWSKLSFKENPYGDPIPDKYLYDSRVMRAESKKKCLAECMQDGYVLNHIFNEQDKTSEAEKEETIQFSVTFHRLEQDGKLCPASFIAGVIEDLEAWDAEHNTRHDDEFYCKTIARSLRTFASMLRENNLRELIEQWLKVESIRRRTKYKIFEADPKEDVYAKTDIALKFAGAFYRVWSYQDTKPGVDMTSKRILKGAGRGFNIMMPFDIHHSSNVIGWAFYDPELVKQWVLDFIVTRKTQIQTYEAYRRQVAANPNVVKTPTIFTKA
jgi:hypothetical protein